MATMQEVIARALRMLRVITPSEEPEAEQAVAGHQALVGLYLSWVHGGLFGPATDVYKTGPYEARENERIAGTTDVTLPSIINEHSRSRAPKDRAFVIVSGADCHLYDEAEAEWRNVSALTLTDVAPLSGRYATALAALLAVELAPEYGRELSQVTQEAALEGRRALGLRAPPKTTLDPNLLCWDRF